MSSSANHLVKVVNYFTLGVSIPGVILSVLLLAVIAYLQWNPVSRPHIDRVSFRLLIYGLGANVALAFTMFPNMKETTPGCSLLAFFAVILPLLSASMFCCIALNLQLVLVYGVNGNMMEKYYVLGAVLLSAACTIPTLAAGELGWYALNGACWLRDRTPAVQLHWLIGTQSVPMLLMSSVEVFSFVNILIFMHHTANSYRCHLFIFCLRPLVYALLAATDPSLIRAMRSLRRKPSAQFANPSQPSTTDSYGLAPMEGGSKVSKTCSTREEASFQVDCERGPSTAEEAEIQEELRSDSIAHQF
ncbi:hypothetical protein B0H13DRAFT_1878682 [Mycena leptocephala]|nr:hypothetical protein B0H13DRAFT_1878682 [Mycena leptocephala]